MLHVAGHKPGVRPAMLTVLILSGALIVYDRFDLWQVPVGGAPAANLTGKDGRSRGIVYRARPPTSPGLCRWGRRL
jgi:tetrahydromethanopterin S-methyltransferase subunit D